MRRYKLLFATTIAVLSIGLFLGVAQQGNDRNSGKYKVRADTQLQAALLTTLDSRNAKPGDVVEAKVLRDLKVKGEKVIRKGDRLRGTVQSAEASLDGKTSAAIGVAFDTVVRGESESSLHTVVSAIVTPHQPAPEMDGLPALEPMAPPTGGATRGGLVGGGTGIVGSATGALGSTTDATIGSVTPPIGASARTALGANGTLAGNARNLRGVAPVEALRVTLKSSTESDTSVASYATITSPKGDVRIESGTALTLRVAEDTPISKAPASK